MIRTQGLTHIHLVVRDLDRSLISAFASRKVQTLDAAITEVEAAGGTLVKHGEHASGVPFAYIRDPDGYLIELLP